MTLSRRHFLALTTTSLVAGLAACGDSDSGADGDPATSVPAPPDRAIAFGFEDVVNTDTDWAENRARLDRIGATAVSLSVGRPDWMAMPWSEHAGWEASVVEETGRDFLAEALTELSGLETTLVVDTLAPRAIERDASVAGEASDGEASEDFPSVSALDGGAYGEQLTAVCIEAARRYRPARIALTELMFDDATFGDADLAHFREHTGNDEFPTTTGGDIDLGHPDIARWRSGALSRLLGRIAEGLVEHDVLLDIDVRAPWSDPSDDRAESGHDYDVLLESADRLVVWNYFGLQDDIDPAYGREVADSLKERFGDRFVMSTGLWASGDKVVSPDDMVASLRAVAGVGAPAVSVTPASLMTRRHWNALEDLVAEWD